MGRRGLGTAGPNSYVRIGGGEIQDPGFLSLFSSFVWREQSKSRGLTIYFNPLSPQTTSQPLRRAAVLRFQKRGSGVETLPPRFNCWMRLLKQSKNRGVFCHVTHDELIN